MLQHALLGLLVVSMASAGSQCRESTDCVPATCCGGTVCVTVDAAEPRCASKTCPIDCRPFSLDCGGYCICTPQGACAAVLNKLDSGDKKCTSKMRKKGECL